MGTNTSNDQKNGCGCLDFSSCLNVIQDRLNGVKGNSRGQETGCRPIASRPRARYRASSCKGAKNFKTIYEMNSMNTSGRNRGARLRLGTNSDPKAPLEHSPPRPLPLSTFHATGWNQPILGTLQCASLRSGHKLHLKLFYRVYASE
jgi:hypothetical protein